MAKTQTKRPLRLVMPQPERTPESVREVRLCAVGAGQWGRHLLHAFARTPDCRITYVCDADGKTLESAGSICPQARRIANLDEALGDSDVNAVSIATDTATHASLGLAALRAGKHVFIEKPLAMSSDEARVLIAAAGAADRKLMVGHLLEYHPAVFAIERLLESGQVGDLLYAYTQRINLGIVRRDENAWWSLAPHDIAVICRLFNAEPIEVAAQGRSILRRGVEDVVFATLRFSDQRMAHIHVSWLDPHKIRKMTLVGARKMVTFDDMSANEKVRLYDKGVDRLDEMTMRTGEIVIPKIDGIEPLLVECLSFVASIITSAPILTDGENGLRVVRILEAGQRSLRDDGGFVPVESP